MSPDSALRWVPLSGPRRRSVWLMDSSSCSEGWSSAAKRARKASLASRHAAALVWRVGSGGSSSSAAVAAAMRSSGTPACRNCSSRGGGGGAACASANVALMASIRRCVSLICSGERGGSPAFSSAALMSGRLSSSSWRRVAETPVGEKGGAEDRPPVAGADAPDAPDAPDGTADAACDAAPEAEAVVDAAVAAAVVPIPVATAAAAAALMPCGTVSAAVSVGLAPVGASSGEGDPEGAGAGTLSRCAGES